MDKTVLYDLSYGLYAIGTKDGSLNCGCIVNTVFQVSNEGPLIAVSLNKDNYTTSLVQKNKRFSVSILSESTNSKVIQDLGFHSGKDNDKWDDLVHTEVNDLPIVKDNCNGYMICELVDTMDADTHLIVLAKVKNAGRDCDIPPMTYAYYHNVIKGKSPKNAPTYREEEVTGDKWVCPLCGYVYDGNDFEGEPDSYKCPICNAPKELFEKK